MTLVVLALVVLGAYAAAASQRAPRRHHRPGVQLGGALGPTINGATSPTVARVATGPMLAKSVVTSHFRLAAPRPVAVVLLVQALVKVEHRCVAVVRRSGERNAAVVSVTLVPGESEIPFRSFACVLEPPTSVASLARASHRDLLFLSYFDNSNDLYLRDNVFVTFKLAGEY